MQNCASISAGTQIWGMQCQKKSEMMSGVEDVGTHGWPAPTRLYQVEKRHMCTLPWKFPPQEMKEQLEPLSQMDSRLAAPPWGLPSSMELSLTIV